MKRIIMFPVLILVIICLLGISVNAGGRLSVSESENTISVIIPSKFNTLTADDIDRDSDFFQDLPISKNEVINRINSGVLIDSFSSDRLREIKLSVTSDSITKKIVNFTPLDEDDKIQFALNLQEGLKNQGHVFLSQPKLISISGYSFVRYYARIGNSTSGYSYTSVMTIIGGKSYELTCYDNCPILTQEMIDANDSVIDSLSLSIKGAQGEIAANTFQTVVSFLITIVAVAVILFIIYTFAKQLLFRSKAPDHIRSRQRRE